MSVFHQLCTPLQEALIQREWKSLRHIQEIAFPEITAGKNVFLIAQTAGGKTEAAFLPTLNQFYGSLEDGVKILYVAPLRALLNNIEDRLISSGICDAVNLQIFKWHGDVGRSKKLTAAKKGTDILLTTPESLDVILCSPYIDKQKFFSPLQVAIIDEAHYFVGSDRGAQLVCLLNRLDLLLNRDIQRICLSATVGNPIEVLSWMCAPSKRQQAVINGVSGRIERTAELIYYPSDDESQIANAVTSYSYGKKSIIFEPSRKQAESRSKDFADSPSICYVHHSSVDKFWREEAEKQLLEAKSAATVIATCTLELGLDVGDLDLIQQEGDFPSVSSYVQRIGRTGRVHPPQRCYVHVTDEFDFLKTMVFRLLRWRRLY
jgi:ATP-dependent Lhr-like helicase